MTYARKTLISLQDTPYYHVVARCVRRAWLWGLDEYAGRDYSHRKAWVLQRLTQLSASFAIDLCAYAIMSNHYHLVVHVDVGRARRWSAREVSERWARLFAKPALIERWEQGAWEVGEEAQRMIEGWRARLCDVSWYMRCLNEHLARRANAEDDCTGRFWEGRFRSQALLDEAGLLTAMAYVDLNPIRAGMAATPEEAEFTSIYERIRELKSDVRSARPPLRPFRSAAQAAEASIPFSWAEYLTLVEWTGRVRREERCGGIGAPLPALMQRLNLDAHAWREAMQSGGNVFGRALGRLDAMRLHAQALGQSWVRGMRRAEKLYGAC